MKKNFLLSLLVSALFSFHSFSQTNFNFFISNSGNDAYPGVSKLLPKQTITGAAATLQKFAAVNKRVLVGLKSSNVFNEAFVPSYPVQVGSYIDTAGNPDFAILNGSDVFNTGWQLQDQTHNTYAQNIAYYGFQNNTVIGTGSFIYVIEIDTALEKTQPFSSRKLLIPVNNITSVETTAGSFYTPTSNANPLPVYIHTSDGSSPNLNSKYRYEVTVRNRGIDSYRFDDNKFENLWVRGYGASYGLLPGGNNSSYKSIIFGPGAARHHVVTKNASFDNCLFLPGPANINVYAVVFYDVQGFNRHNKISNSIFLDVLTPVYAHNSNGSNYNLLQINNTVAFADSNTARVFVSAANTDTITLQDVSTYGYYSSYGSGASKYLSIKNSYFHYAGDGISFGSNNINAEIDNVFITGKDNSRCIKMDINTNLTLTHSILQVSSVNKGGTLIASSGITTNNLISKNNIFIGKVNNNQYALGATTNTDNGIATSKDVWDYNAYIQVSGLFFWGVSNRATNGGSPSAQTFSEWQRQSGQDQHSLFFDLRKDPRGLKAIFLDPENGNYTLANTIKGNKIRALGAGMTNPIHCFLKKPTYEAAANMIRSKKIPDVNSCRNPCQQTSVKVVPSVQADRNGVISICQNQQLSFRGAGNYKENDTYYHQADTTARYLWWFSDGKDTSGHYLHTVTHKFTGNQPTDVRLQMVDPNGCDFDTTFTVQIIPAPANPGLPADTTFCNGETLQLQIAGEAGFHYLWSTGASAVTSIKVTEAGTYSVQVTNTSGCAISDTIKVTNKNPLSINLGNDTTFCSSNPYLLTPVATGHIKSYQWNTGANSDTLRITSAGIYTITAKDSGVCIATDTIVITNNPVNSFSLPSDTIICEGTAYMLTMSADAATVVTWNDGISGYSHLIKSGSYSVVAENEGCIKKDSLIVKSQPYPVVKLRADTLICSGFGLPLSVSYPDADFLWSTGSRDSLLTVTNKGVYWVQATVKGCSFRDSITINVQNCACNLEMPNVFSPNGDGINDVIKPKMDCFPSDYNLSVFNRYGQVVFNTKNYNAAWNGNLKGKPLPVGTYYYILSFNNPGFTNNKPFSGSITLIR